MSQKTTEIRKKSNSILVDGLTMATFMAMSVTITLELINVGSCGVSPYTQQAHMAATTAVMCAVGVIVLNVQRRLSDLYRDDSISNLENN
jgi:hypothetical protein